MDKAKRTETVWARLHQAAQINLRGWRLCVRYFSRGLCRRYFGMYILQALQPYVGVWTSALLLAELAAGRRGRALALYAALAVGLNFLCALGIRLLDYCHGTGQSEGMEELMMINGMQKLLADKLMRTDYANLENAALQRQATRVREKMIQYGNGLPTLFFTLRMLVDGLVCLAASAALTVSLFTSRTGSWLDSPLWAAAILLVLWCNARYRGSTSAKRLRSYNKYYQDSAWVDRAFQFYGTTLFRDLARAKDVRLYRQYETAESEMAKMMAADKKRDGALRGEIRRQVSAASLSNGACYGLCYLFVAAKAMTGAFGVGQVVQYVGALSLLIGGMCQIANFLGSNRTCCQELQELFAYLEVPNRMYQGTLPVEKRRDNDYELEFRHVSFRYPGSTNWALRDVSFRFRIGERLAVVGENGSGKSTFIKLLCRLYDPTEGEVLLNGIDIQKYNYEEYLALFSVVFQDFTLFSFPLGQNVAASTQVEAVQAADCLRRAGFGQRLKTLPRGLDTCLNKDFEAAGVEVSGGEAQKIALARALYKDAPILVLDEPTAALDPIAECEVYENFDRTVGDKTAVYISHRLASCRLCDDIAVFDHGRLVQRGPHQTLLADAGGKYAQLWQAQAQYYTAPQSDG